MFMTVGVKLRLFCQFYKYNLLGYYVSICKIFNDAKIVEMDVLENPQ